MNYLYCVWRSRSTTCSVDGGIDQLPVVEGLDELDEIPVVDGGLDKLLGDLFPSPSLLA